MAKKRGKKSPEGPNKGFEDNRTWTRCKNLNNNQPCTVHRNHKRGLFGTWYGQTNG